MNPPEQEQTYNTVHVLKYLFWTPKLPADLVDRSGLCHVLILRSLNGAPRIPFLNFYDPICFMLYLVMSCILVSLDSANRK